MTDPLKVRKTLCDVLVYICDQGTKCVAYYFAEQPLLKATNQFHTLEVKTNTHTHTHTQRKAQKGVDYRVFNLEKKNKKSTTTATTLKVEDKCIPVTA